MYYKLIDAIDTPITLNVARRVNGYTKYGYLRLNPGTKYELPEDESVLDAIKEAKKTVRYSKKAEDALKACGAVYEKKMCPTCGGKVLKIEYYLVEVVE